MTKQLNLRSTSSDVAIPKRRLGRMHIVIIIILVGFLGKQGLDMWQEWEKIAIESSIKIEAQNEICLKTYNDKLCNQNSATTQCRELLACIQERPSISLT